MRWPWSRDEPPSSAAEKCPPSRSESKEAVQRASDALAEADDLAGQLKKVTESLRVQRQTNGFGKAAYEAMRRRDTP